MAQQSHTRSILPEVPGGDLAVLAYVLAVLVVWAPGLYFGTLTPKIALVLVASGPGAIALIGLARARDRAAWWAVAFLGWALLAALVSANPRMALIGNWGADRGWVLLFGYMASWALGRGLTPSGRRLLPVVLLSGVVASALAGLGQSVFHVEDGLMALVSGRAKGLTPSPLYLGGLVAGALAMVGRWIGRRARVGGPEVAALLVLTVLAAAANASGSRAALGGGAVLAVLGCLMAGRDLRGSPTAREAPAHCGELQDARRRVLGWTLAVVVAVAVGFAVTLPIDSTVSTTSRIGEQEAGGGFKTRAQMWGAGVEATLEHPVVGWGPGRFRPATASRTTAAFVRAEGADRLFFDAHNVFVEQLVTTGVPGLILVAGFALVASRRVRGIAAWFVAGVGLTWLVTPVSVTTAPVALVALGAAMVEARAPLVRPVPASTGRSRQPRTASRAATVAGAILATLGLVAGGCLLGADHLIDQATLNGSLADIHTAQRLQPPDAGLADVEVNLLRLVAPRPAPPGYRRRVVRKAERVVSLDPTRSVWWVHLAEVRVRFGPGPPESRLASAASAYRAALRRSPWSTSALVGAARVALARGDRVEANRLIAKLQQIQP